MIDRLREVADGLGEPYEILCVNDGSTDGTESLLESLAAEDERIRPVHFSRNFGHMAALTAGLELAEAQGAVLCLDADGQHPPEMIPRMVEGWRKGADIVQAVRIHTRQGGFLKSATSRLFYHLLNYLADADLPDGAADFRLLDRQVVDALNALPERVRFVRALVYWVGFRREVVPYEAAPRLAGSSKYGLIQMVQLALSGITSFSTRPLRISLFVGAAVTLLAFFYALYILWCFATGVALVPGWTSMLLVVLTLSGVQLMALGIASEYLARLYFEQKHRPVYLLRKPRDREQDD